MAHVYNQYKLSFPRNTSNKVDKIVEGIIEAIKNRILNPNDRLLPSMQLAGELGVSINTILTAYRVLKRLGWVGKMDTAGTFVAKILPWVKNNPDPKFSDHLMHLPSLLFEQPGEWMNTKKYFTIGHAIDPPYWLSDATASTNNLFADLPRRTKYQWSSLMESDQLIKTAQAILAYKRNASIPLSQIEIANSNYACLDSIFNILRIQGAEKVIMRRSAHWLIYSICKQNGLEVIFVDLPKEGFTVELIRNLKLRDGISLKGCIVYTAPAIEHASDFKEISESRNDLVDYLAQNNVFMVENYEGDSKLDFLGRDVMKYNNIISITTFANSGISFKSIKIVVAPTEFIKKFKKLIRIKHERTCFFIEQMAVWFNNEGALHEGFAINKKRYASNCKKIITLVNLHLKNRFEVVENSGGNSIWLKAKNGRVYTADWDSCPPNLKESIQLNVGYSAGNIQERVSFSKILVYLNLIDLKKLEEFFKWLRE